MTNTPSYICQYGGLFIKFSKTGEIFEFCENVNKLIIYSETDHIYISLVWFSGYSHGSFDGTLKSSNCRTLYMERYPTHKLYQPQIIAKANASNGCHYIVCPPLVSKGQQICAIQLGPPSVGPTALEVVLRDTLEKCDPRLVNTDTGRHFTYQYNISTVFTENWPFGLNNNTHTHKSTQLLSSRNHHNFNYLENGNITSNIICTTYKSRKQLSVFVKISVCEKRKLGILMEISNSIPALSQQCLNLKYNFVTVNKSLPKSKNYHDFMYNVNEGQVIGHVVTVRYGSCSVLCRNYKYSVFVRATDGKTIIEHTLKVGHSTFTGYYHMGFMVTIIPSLCPQPEKCNLYLHIAKPHHPVGLYKTFGSEPHRFGKLELHFARYNPFLNQNW